MTYATQSDSHGATSTRAGSIAALFASIAAAFSASAADDVSGDQPGTDVDVVVTAQKQEERLVDVPVPATVVNTDHLAKNEQMLLGEYYSSVRGLTGIEAGSGGDAEFRTDILVARVSYRRAGGVFGDILPDIDLNDMTRIEVLNGPQGMLYGVGSLGGVIRYVTVQPATVDWGGGGKYAVVSVDRRAGVQTADTMPTMTDTVPRTADSVPRESDRTEELIQRVLEIVEHSNSGTALTLVALGSLGVAALALWVLRSVAGPKK